MVAKTVQLKARYADFRTVTRSRTLPEPTDLADDLARVGRELLAELPLGDGLRLLGLSAHQLLAVTGLQPALPFGGADAPGRPRPSRRPRAHPRRRPPPLRRRRGRAGRPDLARPGHPVVTIRIGLVGCGHIGFVHSYTLLQLTRHGLVDAAVDRHLRRRPEPSRGVRRPPPRPARPEPRRAPRPGRRGVGLHLDRRPPRGRHRGRRAGPGGVLREAARPEPRRLRAGGGHARPGAPPGRPGAATRAGVPRPGRARRRPRRPDRRWRWCSATTSTSRTRGCTRPTGAATRGAPVAGP